MWKSGLDSLGHSCVVLCDVLLLLSLKHGVWSMASTYGFCWFLVDFFYFMSLYVPQGLYFSRCYFIFHAQIPHAEFICKYNHFASYMYVATSILIRVPTLQITCESNGDWWMSWTLKQE